MIIDFLALAALIAPAFLIAITFHEYAHAYMATILGDNTPKMMGRLTLNPFAHIDPLGLIALLLVRVGWAKPVVFNPNNFKRPSLYSVLTGLAGPVSNFILALFFLYLAKYIPLVSLDVNLAKTVLQVLDVIIYVNVMLGTFNLLPIPPLDGSHLLYALLPKRFKHIYFTLSRYAIFVFILLFMVPEVRNLLFVAIKGMKAVLESLVI